MKVTNAKEKKLRCRLLVWLLILFQVLAARTGGPDGYGHIFLDSDEPEMTFIWIDSIDSEVIDELTGLDDDYTTIDAPFPIVLYGEEYNTLYATTNGYITFLTGGRFSTANTDLPQESLPNATVCCYWDDLVFGSMSNMLVKSTGTPGSRRFSITWSNVYSYSDWDEEEPMTFQVVFLETDGETDIRLSYLDPEGLVNPFGGGATVGIENHDGTDGLAYSFNEALLSENLSITFTTGVEGLDISVVSLYMPDTLLSSETIEMDILLANLGSSHAPSSALELTITDGDSLYTESIAIPPLSSGELYTATTSTIDISEDWAGDIHVHLLADLDGDTNPHNDSLLEECFVLARDAAAIEIDLYTDEILARPLPLSAIIANRGMEARDIPVRFVMETPEGDTAFDMTVTETITGLGTDTIFFDLFSPSESLYTARITTYLAGDQVPANDTRTLLVRFWEHIGTGGPDEGGYSWYDSWYDPGILLPPPTEEGGYDIGLTGDDEIQSVSFPFNFDFYDETYESGYVSTNGYLTFAPSIYPFFSNTELPDPAEPNGMICPLWADLYVDTDSRILTRNWPTTEFHIIWWNVGFLSSYSAGNRITFELILYESGDIAFNYLDMETETDSANHLGRMGTVGIEDFDGERGLEYTYNGDPPENRLWNNFTILFTEHGLAEDSIPPHVNTSRLSDTMFIAEGGLLIELLITDARSGVLHDTVYCDAPLSSTPFTRDSTSSDGWAHYTIAGIEDGDDLLLRIAATDSSMNRGETIYSIHAVSLDTVDITPPVISILTADTMHLFPGTRMLPISSTVTDERGILYADLGYSHLGMNYFISPDSTVDSTYFFSIEPLWTDDMIDIWLDASDGSGNLAITDTHSVVIAQRRTVISDGYRIVDSDLLPYEGDMPGYPDSLLAMMAEFSWTELDSAHGGIPLYPDDDDWLSSWISLPPGMFIPYAGRDRYGFRISIQGFITFETTTIPEREIAILPLFAEFDIDSTTLVWYLADTSTGRVTVQWSHLQPDMEGGFTFQLVIEADSGHFDATAYYRDIPNSYYSNFIFHRPPLIGIRNPMLSSPLLFETTQFPFVCRHPQRGSAIRFFNVEDISQTEESSLPEFLSIAASPNPFNSTTAITWSGFEGSTEIEIFDIRGRKTAGWTSLSGEGTRYWAADNPGVYIVRAEDGDRSLSEKIVFVP